MPNSSSSTSSEPVPTPASTPSTSLLLPSKGGKRKATSTSTDSAASPLPSPSNTYDDDHDESDIQKPAKKKPKKVLEKKLPVWKDLKKWKEGEQPLSVFPLEVLDMIISVDSDLDLRDHLALAATCRYFRSCYRDVVFQALVQAAFPSLVCTPDLLVSPMGEPDPFYSYYDFDPLFGPFSRSFNEARRIFSSGRSLVGAGGWNGWGLTRIEYDANQIEAIKQKDVIEQLLLEGWDELLSKKTGATEAGLGTALLEEMTARQIRHQREDAEDRVRQVFDLDSVIHHDLYRPHRRVYASSAYNPWPSFWRARVAEIVNRPTLTKAEAKSKYKVTERELLGLKERAPALWSRAAKHYSKAAVQALALRSHGGVRGHQEHLAKLEVKNTKAQATRTKNRISRLAIYGPSGGGSHQENGR